MATMSLSELNTMGERVRQEMVSTLRDQSGGAAAVPVSGASDPDPSSINISNDQQCGGEPFFWISRSCVLKGWCYFMTSQLLYVSL